MAKPIGPEHDLPAAFRRILAWCMATLTGAFFFWTWWQELRLLPIPLPSRGGFIIPFPGFIALAAYSHRMHPWGLIILFFSSAYAIAAAPLADRRLRELAGKVVTLPPPDTPLHTDSLPGTLVSMLTFCLIFLVSVAPASFYWQLHTGKLPTPSRADWRWLRHRYYFLAGVTLLAIAATTSGLLSTGFPFKLFGIAILLLTVWWAFYTTNPNRSRTAEPHTEAGHMTDESSRLETLEQNLRGHLLTFITEFPFLPPIPLHPLEYEGWFRDARKRAHMRSEKRTAAEHGRFLEELNRIQREWLAFAQTALELRRTRARGTLEDKKIERELRETELAIAKLDVEITQVKAGTLQGEANVREPDAVERIVQKVRSKVRAGIAIDRLKEELAKEHPEYKEVIERIADDEHGRLMDDRK